MRIAAAKRSQSTRAARGCRSASSTDAADEFRSGCRINGFTRRATIGMRDASERRRIRNSRRIFDCHQCAHPFTCLLHGDTSAQHPYQVGMSTSAPSAAIVNPQQRDHAELLQFGVNGNAVAGDLPQRHPPPHQVGPPGCQQPPDQRYRLPHLPCAWPTRYRSTERPASIMASSISGAAACSPTATGSGPPATAWP